MKLLEELKRIFRDPRDLHRVFMVAPLGAMASHGFYLKSISTGAPMVKSEIISIVLAAMLYTMMSLWVLFSNQIHFRLSGRFAFMIGWGAVVHRMIAGIGGFSGLSTFELIFALSCMAVVGIFVVTGWTLDEVKGKVNDITAKKVPAPNVVSIVDRDTNTG